MGEESRKMTMRVYETSAGRSDSEYKLSSCRPVDRTSMSEECEAVMVDHQVCAVRFLT